MAQFDNWKNKLDTWLMDSLGVAINMGCNTVTDYNGEEGDKGLEKNGRFDESLIPPLLTPKSENKAATASNARLQKPLISGSSLQNKGKARQPNTKSLPSVPSKQNGVMVLPPATATSSKKSQVNDEVRRSASASSRTPKTNLYSLGETTFAIGSNTTLEITKIPAIELERCDGESQSPQVNPSDRSRASSPLKPIILTENEERDDNRNDEISIVFSSPPLPSVGSHELAAIMDTVSQSRNDDVSLSALVPDVEVFEGQEEEASVSVQNQPERRDLFQLETDDPTPCAVCGVVDPEPQNEMIFCDVCGLCVHQGCYGVGHIPPGGWKCSPCSVGQNPSEIRCYFCPGYGGALKPVKSPGRCHWAHMSCALWIPEVKPKNDDMNNLLSIQGGTRIKMKINEIDRNSTGIRGLQSYKNIRAKSTKHTRLLWKCLPFIGLMILVNRVDGFSIKKRETIIRNDFENRTSETYNADLRTIVLTDRVVNWLYTGIEQNSTFRGNRVSRSPELNTKDEIAKRVTGGSIPDKTKLWYDFYPGVQGLDPLWVCTISDNPELKGTCKHEASFDNKRQFDRHKSSSHPGSPKAPNHPVPPLNTKDEIAKRVTGGSIPDKTALWYDFYPGVQGLNPLWVCTISDNPELKGTCKHEASFDDKNKFYPHKSTFHPGSPSEEQRRGFLPLNTKDEIAKRVTGGIIPDKTKLWYDFYPGVQGLNPLWVCTISDNPELKGTCKDEASFVRKKTMNEHKSKRHRGSPLEPTRKSLNTKQEVLERGNIPDPRRSTELFTFYHGDPPLYVCRIGNCDKSYHNYYGYQGHRKYKHPETSVLSRMDVYASLWRKGVGNEDKYVCDVEDEDTGNKDGEQYASWHDLRAHLGAEHSSKIEQILKQRIVERSLTAFIRYHIETNGKQPIQNAQLDVTLSPRQSHNPLLKLIWPVFDRDTTRRTRIRDNAPHFVTVLLLVKVPIQQEDWGLHQIITFNYNNPFFVAKVYYDSCIEPKLCSFHEKYPEYSNPAKLVKEGWLAYSMLVPFVDGENSLTNQRNSLTFQNAGIMTGIFQRLYITEQKRFLIKFEIVNQKRINKFGLLIHLSRDQYFNSYVDAMERTPLYNPNTNVFTRYNFKQQSCLYETDEDDEGDETELDEYVNYPQIDYIPMTQEFPMNDGQKRELGMDVARLSRFGRIGIFTRDYIVRNGRMRNRKKNEGETLTNTRDPFLLSLDSELQEEDKDMQRRANEPYYICIGFAIDKKYDTEQTTLQQIIDRNRHNPLFELKVFVDSCVRKAFCCYHTVSPSSSNLAQAFLNNWTIFKQCITFSDGPSSRDNKYDGLVFQNKYIYRGLFQNLFNYDNTGKNMKNTIINKNRVSKFGFSINLSDEQLQWGFINAAENGPLYPISDSHRGHVGIIERHTFKFKDNCQPCSQVYAPPDENNEIFDDDIMELRSFLDLIDDNEEQ